MQSFRARQVLRYSLENPWYCAETERLPARSPSAVEIEDSLSEPATQLTEGS